MRITPKIGEQNLVIPDAVSAYIHMNNTMEIQMTSRNLQKAWQHCKFILDNFVSLEEVVLHMPFERHTINAFISNPALQRSLIELMVDVMRYSDKYDIKIAVLFHVEGSMETFIEGGGYEFTTHLLKIIEGSNAYILVENSLPDFSALKPERVGAIEIIQAINHDKLRACFDICHFKASENALKRTLELPLGYLSRVNEIHFSATLDGDGFLDKKKTHGQIHPDYLSLLTDIKWLVDTGFDLNSAMLTAEISESDYEARPKMLKELSMMYQAEKELGTLPRAEMPA